MASLIYQFKHPFPCFPEPTIFNDGSIRGNESFHTLFNFSFVMVASHRAEMGMEWHCQVVRVLRFYKNRLYMHNNSHTIRKFP